MGAGAICAPFASVEGALAAGKTQEEIDDFLEVDAAHAWCLQGMFVTGESLGKTGVVLRPPTRLSRGWDSEEELKWANGEVGSIDVTLLREATAAERVAFEEEQRVAALVEVNGDKVPADLKATLWAREGGFGVVEASGKLCVLRADPTQWGNVLVQWADISRDERIEMATLREATAAEKARFEEERRAAEAAILSTMSSGFSVKTGISDWQSASATPRSVGGAPVEEKEDEWVTQARAKAKADSTGKNAWTLKTENISPAAFLADKVPMVARVLADEPVAAFQLKALLDAEKSSSVACETLALDYNGRDDYQNVRRVRCVLKEHVCVLVDWSSGGRGFDFFRDK